MEGPIGQHPLQADVIHYTRDDAEKIAMQEIAFYTAGLIYGYSFNYQPSNPIDGREENFVLTPNGALKINDRGFEFRQYEVSQMSIRLQGTYRLQSDQKNFIHGYRGARLVSTSGVDNEAWSQDWSNRKVGFEAAIKNAILNYARTSMPSRPLELRGRLTLREAPKFSIKSGAWLVRVKINLLIDDREFIDDR